MPLILSQEGPREKAAYLNSLLDEVYMVDIVERYGLRGAAGLGELVNVLASSIGSPTNPNRIADTFVSKRKMTIDDKTVRRYIGYPSKYYFEDHGLRNACLNFRQIDEGHLMENVIYNELRSRGFSVDVGEVTRQVTIDGSKTRQRLEVDFVANLGYRRYYIQSALNLDTDEKREQEKRSLRLIGDSFKKIVIVNKVMKPYMDDDGILTMGLFDFLLNPSSLEF